MTDLVPLAFRGNWLSLLSGIWSVGTVTGPLIGAGFAQNITWRWIFYVNLPVIGLGIVFVALFLHQAKILGHTMEKFGRFDWVGCILFTASLTSFLFGLTTGGIMYKWSSWRVLLPLLIGPVGLLIFGWYEVTMAREPIIHKGLFNNRDMIVTYIMTILHGMILWSLLYFLRKLILPNMRLIRLISISSSVLPRRQVLLAHYVGRCYAPRNLDRDPSRRHCWHRSHINGPLPVVSMDWMDPDDRWMRPPSPAQA